MQKKKRLDRTDEVALVLSVKQKFEVDFAQKALLKKVASHLKQTVASNYHTRNILEEQNEILERDILELRAQKNYIYETCLRIDQSNTFSIFISLCIVGNTLILAMDTSPINSKKEQT